MANIFGVKHDIGHRGIALKTTKGPLCLTVLWSLVLKSQQSSVEL